MRDYLKVMLIGFCVFWFSSQTNARSLLDWWKDVTGPRCSSIAEDIDKEIVNCGKLLEIELHEARVSSAHNRGILWRRKGKSENAIRDFGIALKKHPNLHSSLFERGRTFMMMGNCRSAIRDFTKLLRWYRTNQNGFYNRGLCYETLGNIKSAQ